MIAKRIALIIPYFGNQFPNYFQLFLNSCKYNSEFTWLIFTNCKIPYEYPENVCKIDMTFEELVNRFSDKFDFEICLNRPYKLCDYKCAYGYIFDDYLKNYDFWGHTDCDLIYGKLSNFITDDILDNYDKILTLGHLTLYRNVPYISRLFKEKLKGEEYYKKVFMSDENYNFDEDWNGRININDIFREYGRKIFYNENNRCHIADLYTKTSDFRVTIQGHQKERNTQEKRRKNSLFIYNKGVLTRYDKDGDDLKSEEYMYIHFHQRPMKISVDPNDETYAIIPNSFVKIDLEKIESNYDAIRKKYMNLQYFRIRWGNLKVKIKKMFA